MTTQTKSGFHWTISAFPHALDSVVAQSFAENSESWFEGRRSAREEGGTRTLLNSPGEPARIARDRAHEETLLSRLAGRYTRRIDPQRGWRMLALNPVLHFQFGPALCVATNGVDVLLWADRSGDDWTLAHRANVVGPLTSRPVAASEWDYESNRPKMKFGGKVGAPALKQLSARALRAKLLDEI